jgi:hypothetical protein
MTAAEFARALAAFGFSSTAGGLRFVDDASGAAFDGVRNHARGRLARRATLSKILRERNRGSDR